MLSGKINDFMFMVQNPCLKSSAMLEAKEEKVVKLKKDTSV